MKHFIVIFLVALLAFGCDDDDNNYHEYHYEYIAVKSVELPDEFIFGQIYDVDVTIDLLNSCYYHYGQFDYFYEGTSRLIYPIVHVDDDKACAEVITETTFSIPVHVLQTETYIFKFYQGENAQGEDIFLTVEVPVN